MGKRRKSKRLTLSDVPLLLTKVRAGHWAGGVLLLEVESGKASGVLALGPHITLALTEVMARASRDNAAPFNRTRADLVRSPAEKEAKP
jgi:hypothetical protein